MFEVRFVSDVIQAPMKYSSMPRPWVFLSGSIAMGEAEYWQEEVASQLRNCTVLNPRRDDWDSSWEQSINDSRFREQVEWELDALASATLTLVYFDPDTYAPITLMELGLQVGRSRQVLVCCPEGFYRRGNVEITCKRLHVPFYDTKAELIEAANVRLYTLTGYQ